VTSQGTSFRVDGLNSGQWGLICKVTQGVSEPIWQW